MAQNATMVWNSNGLAPNITNLDQCTLALCDIKQWGSVNYLPSLTANAIYGGLFAIFFCIHLIFVCIYRTWSYSAPMCLGLTLEVLGYFGRLAMHYNIFNTNLFLVNIICLTIAPVFFTAAIYLTLARVIVHYEIYNSRISPKVYSIIFMTSDVISLILQSVGGGIADAASTESGKNEGTNIMVAGLSFQVISLVLFMFLAAEFFFKVKKDRAHMRNLSGLGAEPKGYKSFVWAFAIASFLILIRSAYRVAELAHGFRSKLANDQMTFIIFESATMVLALCFLTVFHPGRFIGRAGWKLSGWGKNANVQEKAPSPAMDSGDWTPRYGNGQPTANKAHAPNRGDNYQPLEFGEVNPYHSQVHPGHSPTGGAEERVKLMDRVE